MPKWIVGLLCLLGAVVLDFTAVRFNVYTSPDMDNVEMWKAMSWGLRLLVISAYLLFLTGCGLLVRSIADRFRKRTS